MSLQFIFGNSGSGKSDFLYDSVLKQAKENKEQQFLIIVPEQFTMQTQRELVERQKQHAIMNVDVLSFARLAYRVFDDLGKQNVVVLEETGKNLVSHIKNAGCPHDVSGIYGVFKGQIYHGRGSVRASL